MKEICLKRREKGVKERSRIAEYSSESWQISLADMIFYISLYICLRSSRGGRL